ncbi:YciI family protein [Sanguibacter sp. A247]|uniref:YciI family protein n=1 Tax=unclassified Sanguibacter TaxID=2645534 RepID=UPI003FD6EB33
MTVYSVQYTYTDDTATLDAVRPEHRAYLRSRLEAGTLLASGPLEGGRALLLLNVEGRPELDVLLGGDPFAAAGVLKTVDVAEWKPVIGPWAALV